MENEEVLPDGGERLVMQLFVSGMSPKSMEAIENAKHLFGEDPGNRYQLEIIDLYKHPEAAQSNHIVFTPSLVKSLPLPRKILVGNLADTEKVLKALGITSK